MKRILFLLAALTMLAASAHAEHFKFMGIPLDGSLPQFEKALLAKGFTPTNLSVESPNYKWYEGIYYNNNALLGVCYSPKSKTVCSVGIGITPADAAAKSEFAMLCRAIENKYPNHTKTIEQPEANTVEKISYWIGDLGRIVLSLHADNMINIFYGDRENNLLYDRERNEDI